LISGVLPVKNGSALITGNLPRMLESLGHDDELIVVDDNSIDDTYKALENFQIMDPRIRLLTNKGEGLVSALNLGFRESRGEWIARFDIDDKYLPNRLEYQRMFFAENVSAIFSDYRVVSDAGSALGTIRSPIYPANTKLSLIHSQRTSHPSAIINKSAFLDVGGYRSSDFPAEDLSLWLRLSNNSEIVSVGETLMEYVVSKKSTSNVMRHLVNQKRIELIRSRNPDFFLNDSFFDFDYMLYLYERNSFSTERLLLSLYDLTHPWVRRSFSNAEKLIVQRLFLHTVGCQDGLGTLYRLISNRIRRRVWRLCG